MTEQLIGKIGDGSRLCILAICTLTAINNKAYATHLQFAYKLAKDNPDFQFILFTPYRMSISNFRTSAARAALDTKAEYLLFVDDDAVLIGVPDLFKRLLEKIDDDEDKHMVMPLCYVRGYPFDPMFFKWVKPTDEAVPSKSKGLELYTDFRDQPVNERELLEVAAIGCHTALIKVEVFKAFTEPYFMTGMFNTEDVFFCMKCHDYIENVGIYVATDIHVSHLLDPLYVNDENVEILRKLHEDLDITGKANFEELVDNKGVLKRNLADLGEDFEK